MENLLIQIDSTFRISLRLYLILLLLIFSLIVKTLMSYYQEIVRVPSWRTLDL